MTAAKTCAAREAPDAESVLAAEFSGSTAKTSRTAMQQTGTARVAFAHHGLLNERPKKRLPPLGDGLVPEWEPYPRRRE